MVFRPLTGYTMAKGSYSRIFVGIVFRPLTGYTIRGSTKKSLWARIVFRPLTGYTILTALNNINSSVDSLPSPYGVYRSSAVCMNCALWIVFRPLTGYTSKNIQKVTAKHPANQTFSTSIILLYHTPLQKGIP